MSSYVRPSLPRQVFRDASGAEIEYGNRWGMGETPEETYHVASHPERFAVLHTVADELIDHLVATYDVRREDALEADGRVVRLRPARGDGAPLELTFTGYPGLRVRAGVWGDFVHPVCGCDACDESAEEQVEDLEQLVFAVAAGRFQEEYRAHSRTPVRYHVGTVEDGDHRAGSSPAKGMSRARLAEGRRRLRALPAGWAPWPPAATT